MGYKSALEVMQALTEAYYKQRAIEPVLACVTEDIAWIGPEGNNAACSKAELREWLAEDIRKCPQAIKITPQKPRVTELSPECTLLTIDACQEAVNGVSVYLNLRATLCCVLTSSGWLIKQMHASVANNEIEKRSLSLELDETRRKEQMLLGAIPGGIAIYRLKKDGRVETDYVSDGLGKMCGYTADEFLTLLKTNAIVNLVPEDVPLVNSIVQASVEQNKPIHAVYRIFTKAHKPIWIRLEANIIRGQLAKDDVALLYAVHTPVAEETQRLYDERRQFQEIFTAMDLAFLEWEVGGKIYASPSFERYALSKCSAEEIFNSAVREEVVHPNDVLALCNFRQSNSTADAPASVTVRLKMMDGSYRWTDLVGFTHAMDHKTQSKVLILRDVNTAQTEQQKVLQEALAVSELASDAKTRFLSRVSHDMRTPLNGILGLLRFLKDRIKDRAAIADLNDMELASKYLLNLINDTLDVSRIESGKLELHPAVCDGRTVFNNVVRLIRPIMEEKNIDFVVEVGELPFSTLYLDVGRTEQIVMNVLSNASKFTPEGGKVELRMRNVSVEHGVITDEIIIKDTGIGMSKEFLEHIFEPFSQENESNHNAQQGTGLGMAISKELLKLMGGEIDITSEVGVGTTVRIMLPMQIATEEQVAGAESFVVDAQIDNSLAGKRVLLCEDHPLNVKIATRLLENRGIIVDHAENGKEGVELFVKSIPGYYDAVLMDVRMPVMDGLEATTLLRSLKRRDAQSIPIIAMTANAFEEDEQQGMAVGMNAYLSKPVDVQLLYATLEKFISWHKKRILPRVLIVDDVEINRVVIRAALESEYEVYEAGNGKEALQVLKEHRGINVLITDIQMPIMNGLELIKSVRSEEEYRHMLIIANTQFGDFDQEEKLLALGANDFIYKPSTPKIVAMRVRNALRNI